MDKKACFTLKRTNWTNPGGLSETDLLLILFNWIIGYQQSRGKSKKFQIIEIKKTDNVTESVILIDPLCKDDNVWFTTVFLKASSYQIRIRFNVYNFKYWLISISGSLQKLLGYFYCRKHLGFIRNKQTYKQTTVYQILLIRLRFYGYHCKSGIAIFSWRVPWNYACSPFQTSKEKTE